MFRSVGRTFLLAAPLLFGGATVAESQVFTPTYMAPRSSSDVGIYLSDGPGEFAVEGIWRRMFGGYDLGFRAGLADLDDLGFLVGGEYRNPLALGAPLDISVTGAVQALLGDLSSVGFLVGASVGHTFVSDELAFTPYIHPRVGPVQGFVSDEFDLELLGDIGLDIAAGSRLDVRIGFGLETRGAEWGVGLAWR